MGYRLRLRGPLVVMYESENAPKQGHVDRLRRIAGSIQQKGSGEWPVWGHHSRYELLPDSLLELR